LEGFAIPTIIIKGASISGAPFLRFFLLRQPLPSHPRGGAGVGAVSYFVVSGTGLNAVEIFAVVSGAGANGVEGANRGTEWVSMELRVIVAARNTVSMALKSILSRRSQFHTPRPCHPARRSRKNRPRLPRTCAFSPNFTSKS